MDKFDAMKIFTRVAERQSFSQAAQDLSLAASTVTTVIKGLENNLGVRLFERTTRVVKPTLDGELYYERCIRILQDIEDAEAVFKGGEVEGRLKVDLHGTQARFFIFPKLHAFLDKHPKIDLYITERHQPLNMITENYDCLLRVGHLYNHTSLVSRSLANLERGVFVSPLYIKKYGVPGDKEELKANHKMVGLLNPDIAGVTPFTFINDNNVESFTIPVSITVESPESNIASACAGLGIIQVPRYRVASELKNGVLVEVLPTLKSQSIPVQALYLSNRKVSPRLKVFLDWLSTCYADNPT